MPDDSATSGATVAEMAQTSAFPMAPSWSTELPVTATITLAEDEALELSAAVGETAEVAADAIDLHAVSDTEWEVILYFHEADKHRRTAVAGSSAHPAPRGRDRAVCGGPPPWAIR